MNYIHAVNISLRAMGERAVSDINSTRPSVDLVKQTLDEVLESVLASSYWFNEEVSTIVPDLAGNLVIPENTLSINTLDSRDRHLQKRGNVIIDVTDTTRTFTDPVKFKRTVSLAFEDIPKVAQDVIAYRTAEYMLVDDDMEGKKIQSMAARAQAAGVELYREEVKQRQDNRFLTAGTLTLRSPNSIPDPTYIGGR